MERNWIILDDGGTGRGVPVNVNFLIKVLYGGYFVTKNDPLKVVVFHGVTATTLGGSTTCMTFASANLALAAYNRLISVLIDRGLVSQDLRIPGADISAVSPATVYAGIDQTITLTGTGFTSDGKVTIGADDYAITFSDATSISFTLPIAFAAGTYDIEYTNPAGVAAVFEDYVVVPAPTLVSVLPTPYAAGTTTTITVTGTGFSADGHITVNGTDYGIAFTSDISIAFDLPGSVPAGTYDVTYTNPAGNTATLAAGLTLT